MEPTQSFLDELRKEEIDDAKRLSTAQKLTLGGDLFDMACQVTMSGIRMQNPGITDDQVLAILRKRLETARQLETRL